VIVDALCRWLFSRMDPAPPRGLPEELAALPMPELRAVLRYSGCAGRIGRALIESSSRIENLALLRETAVYLNTPCVITEGLSPEEKETIEQWVAADAEKRRRVRWE